MKFINKTGNELIETAIKFAEECLVPNSKIMKLVSIKNDWKYGTKLSGYDLVYALCIEYHEPIEVKFYKSFNPWSAAIAYYDGSAIYFNTRKLSKIPVDITKTLCHEWAHHCGFSHGNNYKTEDKCKYSVPYFLSENI